MRRKNEPFRAVLSIHGGFTNKVGRAENAVMGEAKEGTSLIEKLHFKC